MISLLIIITKSNLLNLNLIVLKIIILSNFYSKQVFLVKNVAKWINTG